MTANLRCNCAARTRLTPLFLEPDLPAAACQDCGAVLLQMEDWRRWRIHHAHQTPATTETRSDAAASDHGRARHCIACARLMERLPVDAKGTFRVDRCVHCQHLWLDRGEWQALVHGGLAHQLDTLLSDAGQRRLQGERLQMARMQALRQRHGDACIDEVMRIRLWLAGQAHRDEILALLRANEMPHP